MNMRLLTLLPLVISLATPASASDWEKFYTPLEGAEDLLPSAIEPEAIEGKGDLNADIEQMWRKGFAAVGYTYFNASNTKNKDGIKLAKKLKARYFVYGVDYTGSTTGSLPITTPNTSTTYSSGQVFSRGTGGYRSGTYSGTSTTYGSQTSYIPFSVPRYDKYGIYFREVPKRGIGILFREPDPSEIARIELRRALVVTSIRDDSPADNANILPNDIIISVNDQPATYSNLTSSTKSLRELRLKIFRNGRIIEQSVVIPDEWRN